MRFSRSCFGKTFAMTQMWCREPEGLFVGQKQAVVLMYIYRSELFPSRSGWPDGYIVQYLYQYCHLKIWDMIGRFSGYFNLLGKEDNLTFGYIYIYIITNVNVYILYADKYMDIGTWMSWLFQQRQVTATQSARASRSNRSVAARLRTKPKPVRSGPWAVYYSSRTTRDRDPSWRFPPQSKLFSSDVVLSSCTSSSLFFTDCSLLRTAALRGRLLTGFRHHQPLLSSHSCLSCLLIALACCTTSPSSRRPSPAKSPRSLLL